MAAFAGGCAVKLRAVCWPVEVHGVAAAMADAEVACGESRTCCVVGLIGGSSGASGSRGTCEAHWGGRARRVRTGRAGRRGTPGVCHRRRKSSACVARVVMEHDATGVVAPGQARGLDHAHDDDNDGS